MSEPTIQELRVARVLFLCEWADHGGETEFDDSLDYWLKSARAAIAAMQELSS